MFRRKIATGIAFAAACAWSGEADAQAPRTCNSYSCDTTTKCRWQVVPKQLPGSASLDKQLAAGTSRARFTGYCDADQPRPLQVDGFAMSVAPRLTLTQASSSASTAQWEVHHIRTCIACRYTEGRGRAEARVSFVARASIRDPASADARADVLGSLKAKEATTSCEARLDAAGVSVATSGAVTFGVTAGGAPGSAGSAGLSGSINGGNARALEQLCHDSDQPPEVEMNDYYVTLEAALDRGLLQVDGWALGFAQAAAAIEPGEFQLRLHLSCDWCTEKESRLEAVFPQ